MKGPTKMFALAVLALGFCGAANAQTAKTLPTPIAASWGTETVQAAVTGFSADGNYVLGHSRGYVAHGHSGRGGGYKYLYYCRDWKWDLSGVVVDFTDHGAGTDPGTYFSCPPMNGFLSFTNSGGYQAYSKDLSPNSTYYGHIWSPVLASP